MVSRSTIPALSLAAALALAGCGGSGPAKPAAGAAGGGLAPAKLGRKMPEYVKSGMAEEWKRFSELDSGLSHSRTEDEKTKAEKEMEAWKADFPPRWEGKDVPGPECLMYARMLQKCEKFTEAVIQARKYLAVSPDDTPNYVNATTLLIGALAQSGDFAGADRELKANLETVYKTRDLERKGVEDTIANAMYFAGKIEEAAPHFERSATTGYGDINSCLLAVDCFLRLGRASEAVAVVDRCASMNKEGKNADRARQLQQQVALVGKPAPGFSAVHAWEGTGGPVSDKQLKGVVTVVFSWNMQKQWNQWFFERVNKLAAEYAERGVQVIGVSRLAKFDANRMKVDPEMTEEKELAYYHAWVGEFKVTYALAIGAYQDENLINAWGFQVVPTFVVVGKDGIVNYFRTGKDEKYFPALREMIDKALAK